MPESVVTDANWIKMTTQHVHLWAENAAVGVCQWVAETMGNWQEKGGMTKQWKDNKVREHIREIAQYMRITNKLGIGPEKWDLIIDHCVTQISDMASQRPLWIWFMPDKTICNGQKLKVPLDKFTEVEYPQTKDRIDATPTKQKKFVHNGICLVTPFHLLLFLMKTGERRGGRENLASEVFTNSGPLPHLDLFPCWAIYRYTYSCRSWRFWEEGGWKQYSAILMALSWGWWVNPSDVYINGWNDHFVNHECSNRWSARPQIENPRALGLQGGA